MTTCTTLLTTEEVLHTIRAKVQEVVGEDIEIFVPIGLNTSFKNDLDLETVKLMVLAENLQEYYEGIVDILQWMSKKSLEDIGKLTVGELVNYIVKSCA
jgi:acyl carrier protein